MTICTNPKCGAHITGQTHHSGERGLALCHECAHPGQPCPAAESSSGRTSGFEPERLGSSPSSAITEPYNALPESGALNKQGKKSSKKNRPTSQSDKPSLARQSTTPTLGQDGVGGGEKIATEGERGKGTIPEGGSHASLVLAETKERAMMAEEKQTRRRRKKGLLDWQPTSWRAGGWIIGIEDGLVKLDCEYADGSGGDLVMKFTSVEEAQDYAEAIEGHRQRWSKKGGQ